MTSPDTESATLRVRPKSSADDDPVGQPHLVVLVGQLIGRRFELSEDTVVGRGAQCPVEILDDGVSRRHCRVIRVDEGWEIEDLGSRNGTHVNGERIERQPLQLGDKIAVGSQTVLLFTGRDRFEEQRIQAQKLQALGQLAGGIAHDFNNLLGVVLANVTHLLGHDSALPAASRASLGEVETAARRAVDLTNQLLAFARSGRREHVVVATDAIVDDATRLLRRTLDQSIVLDVDARPALPVSGDPSQLLQVLMNLCINAGDAMPEGGELSIATRAATLDEDRRRPDALPPGEYVELRVRDTGTGIDAATIDRIFEPFFTTKPKGRGTGLGLATAAAIVRDHGGSITVASDPGVGTTFTVRLPRSPLAPVALARATQDGPSVAPQGVVLVADDEELVRFAAKRVLTNAGLNVLTAGDGVEAVQVFKQQRETIDLVVLDLDMPRLNGAQAFEEIRQISPGARVLISSGYVDAGREQGLREAGVQGFVHKPYDSVALLSTVAKALREGKTPG